MSTEKYIGEAQIKGNLKNRFRLMIAPEAIKTEHIADKQITPEKLSPRVQQEVVRPLFYDLQNQINTLGADGTAISKYFGMNENVGISQETLTLAINEIWYKLEEITGETLRGIVLNVTPEYYIGETGCDINISADTIDENGLFEKVDFYINDVWVAGNEGVNVHHFEFDTHIDETSVIRCDATILGIDYTRSTTITHYSPFWVGAGSDYSSVMKMANIRNIGGNYNITFTAGQNLIIVVEDILRDRFVRADMKGVEIQFTETTKTISGKTYKVLTSENTYQAGTYNIDINS